MKKIGFIFLFTLVQLLVHGQNVSLQNIIPPSPEASAFAKYGSYPVGSFTGRPDINIPIYEVKTKNFSVPISLSYDATGIRVDDIAGWAGLNWSLNAGGMISRTVMCIPDDEPYGFLSAPPPRVNDIVNTPSYIDYFRTLLIDFPSATNSHDTDPDRFQYSFNGRSGSFLFKSDQSILQIPQTSLKISFEPMGFQNNRFTITDENGAKYLFTAIEKSNVYITSEFNASSNLKTMITGWCLSEMISNDGTDHIYFNYEDELYGSQRTNNFTETYGAEKQGSSINFNAHSKFWRGMERTVLSKRLKSIVFTGGKVEFARVLDRQDDLGSRLDEISIYSTNDNTNFTKLKSFKLQHGYYYSSGDYTNIGNGSFGPVTRDRYRLRLDALKLKDAGGNEISSYQYQYNSTMLPPKTSCAQDWWGYPNGTENHTLVPATVSPTGEAIGGANRAPSEPHMKSGILEKIIYPTKGFTIFETEAHKFNSGLPQIAGESYSGTAYGFEGGLHRKIVTFTTPGAGELISGSGSIMVFMNPYTNSGNPSYNDPNDQQYASLAPQVKIKNLSSGQETVYTSSNSSQYYGVTFNYDFIPGTPYEITAICYKNHNGAMVTMSVYFKKNTWGPGLAGGLRIKSIKNYTADNLLTNQENYVYGQNEQGLGSQTGIGVYSNTTDYSTNAHIALQSGVISFPRITYGSGFVFDQTPLQGSPVAYRYVTKYFGDASNNIGKTVYYYGDDPFVQTFPFPYGMELANNMGILVVSNNWKIGALISQQDFKRKNDGTYEQVSKLTNTYNTQNTDASYGLLAKVRLFEQVGNENLYTLQHFAYAEYPIGTGFQQLTQTVKEENLPDVTNKLTTTTNYTYDNTYHDFNIGITSTNSKGQLLELTKKYPFNKAGLEATGSLSTAESTAIDNMVSRNMITPVLEEIQKKAGVQMSRKRMQYELVNSTIIAPVAAKFQTSSFPIETRLSFTGYDGVGNLVEQQKVNDVTKSYLWDYQSVYPIAEVSNAPQAAIAYTSFEADGSGKWTIGSTTRIATDRITGKNCYQLSNGAINRSGLNSAITYIVSYWTKNSNAVSITGTQGTPTQGRSVNGWNYFEHKVTGVSQVSLPSTSALIDELRLYPYNAQMVTYTYEPLVGISSSCDVNNHMTYYEYDAFGRLKVLRDQDGNIIKTMDYHYQQ